MRFKRGQKGFTLMELMVVMAILAILSGIVAGGVVGVGTQGKEVTITSDQKVIQSAADRFYSDADPQVYPILEGDVTSIKDEYDAAFEAGTLTAVEADATVDDILTALGDGGEADSDYQADNPSGTYVIAFGYELPAVGDADAKFFVPNYVKETPSSADRVTWVIELPDAVVSYIGDPSGALPVAHPDAGLPSD